MLTSRKKLIAYILFPLSLFLSYQSSVSARTVEVFDTGLNMLRQTVELPDGWKLDVDIASNPATGQYMRFKNDVIGPDGEMMRELPPVFYGMLTGMTFEQTWRYIISEAAGELMDVETTGELIENGPIATRSLKALGVTSEQLKASGGKIFEVMLSGKKGGQNYKGVLVFSVQPFDGQSGMLTAGIIASPSQRFDATIDTSISMSKTQKMDAKYDATRASLINQNTRLSAAQHNRRMQNNQQMFNQRQKMINDRSKMFDQQHQQWMNNNFSGGASGSQDYSSHDAYIDSIHETSTFADPDSGQNRTLDGQYQYNYTDGMGNYYGTDNPSFEPGMMPNGDWQEIQPLQPGY